MNNDTLANLEVATAYETALRTAQIDAGSVRWLRRDTIRIVISGREYRARLDAITADGLRVALAKCLDEHCTITAVAAVASNRGS